MDVLSPYLALLLVLNGLLKKNHSQTLIVLLLSMEHYKFEGLENAGLQKVFILFFLIFGMINTCILENI